MICEQTSSWQPEAHGSVHAFATALGSLAQLIARTQMRLAQRRREFQAAQQDVEAINAMQEARTVQGPTPRPRTQRMIEGLADPKLFINVPKRRDEELTKIITGLLEDKNINHFQGLICITFFCPSDPGRSAKKAAGPERLMHQNK